MGSGCSILRLPRASCDRVADYSTTLPRLLLVLDIAEM
jgi:hypothetical protein